MLFPARGTGCYRSDCFHNGHGLDVTVRSLTIIAILSGMLACRPAPINMVREGTVNVEYSSSPYLHFSSVGIYGNEVGVIIVGELHKRGHGRGAMPGHIEIEIPIDLPINSTVRIMHNDALRRESPKS